MGQSEAECRRKVCDWLKVTCHDGQVCEPIENRGFENGIYLFDVKNRKESFDYIKVPQVVETGWQTFKLAPMTMDKDERKRVTLKSFDDCLQEKIMEELCQSFAELVSKN